MATITSTLVELDIFTLFDKLEKFDINYSPNEIMEMGGLILNQQERLVVRKNKLMLEVA